MIWDGVVMVYMPILSVAQNYSEYLKNIFVCNKGSIFLEFIDESKIDFVKTEENCFVCDSYLYALVVLESIC